MHNPKSLGEKPISKLLWEFSLPAVTAMLVNGLYNVVDSIFVGNGVGELGLAAVTIVFPIMLILMAFGMLIGIGATAQVSLSIGKKNKELAEKILGNAFSLTFIIGIVLSLIFLLFLDPILIALGAEESTMPYARDFSQIIIAGSIFSHIAFGLNNIIRAEGSPKTAMATMLISAGLNICLNPLFIFYLNMGIKGSAWATVISQIVTSALVVSYFIDSRGYLKLYRSNLKLDLNIIKNIIAIGMSPFFMQLAACIIMVLFNYSLIKHGGETALAAMGIINRISLLTLMPIFGISQGVQPIIGYNYGAGNYQRAIKALKQAIYAATAITTAGFFLVEVFSIQIISLFNNNSELIDVGSYGIKICLVMLPVIGFQIIGGTFFQAIGKAKHSLFLSTSRQILILIPMIIILPQIWGLNGVWFASPVSDFFSAVITAILLYRETSLSYKNI